MFRIFIVLALLLVCTLNGCVSSSPPAVEYKDCWDGSSVPSSATCPPQIIESEVDCVDEELCEIVTILFGTDRRIDFDQDAERLNLTRLLITPPVTDRPSKLSLGTLDISVPVGKNRDPGQITTPDTFLGFQTETLSPYNHFVFTGWKRLTEEEFAASLKQNRSFIFVHGFNISFKDAAMRTAQLKVDANFTGDALMYSWPAKKAGIRPNVDYETSRKRAEDTRENFREFIDIVRGASGDKKISIIAHSMGNYMMMEVLAALNEEVKKGNQDAPPIFDQIVFVAPDVGRTEFQAWLRRMEGLSNGFTLYASDKDWALRISREYCQIILNGQCDTRAGSVTRDGGALVLPASGLETIDVSNIDTGFGPNAAHSAFATALEILIDIGKLIQFGQPAPRSCQWKMQSGIAGPYWVYPDPDSVDCSSEGCDC